MLETVPHTCNLSTWKAKTGGLPWVQGYIVSSRPSSGKIMSEKETTTKKYVMYTSGIWKWSLDNQTG